MTELYSPGISTVAVISVHILAPHHQNLGLDVYPGDGSPAFTYILDPVAGDS